MNFLEKRHLRKTGKDILRHAHHVRNMREDILPDTDLKKLGDAEATLKQAIRNDDIPAIETAGDALYVCANHLVPPRPFAKLREDLEVIVVAVAVAMAFRAYFIQPFKIPTGSMQPTLYGIHSRTIEKPGITDRVPLKYLKWAWTGDLYKEIVVKVPGVLSEAGDPSAPGPDDPSVRYVYVGQERFSVPKDARVPAAGTYMSAGSLLWAGIVTAGDHVFVDKVRWNFCRPKRGSIMVFSTEGILGLMQGTYYIKRMVGVPGDTVGIDTPNVVVNGENLMEPEPVAKISRRDPPYDDQSKGYGFGYIPPPNTLDGYFRTPKDVLILAPGKYLGFGDNTHNSFDGRYWGTVPEANLVGPAWMVYWPFSKRWGIAR